MRLLSLPVLLAAMVTLTGCTIIEPGYRGVKVTLGRMNSNLLAPGMQIYVPGIDHIIPYTTKQTTLSGQAIPLTSDQQPITVEYKVLYRLSPDQILTLYEKYQGDPYQRLVEPQIQEAFRQIISQYKADQATRNVNTIKNQVLSMVRENVKGLVDVVDVPITHVDLPEALLKAISQKQVMEQQALQKAYELDKAKKEAEITITTAQAQAESIRLQSQALQTSPLLVEWEKVKKWDGKLPQSVVGGSAIFSLK